MKNLLSRNKKRLQKSRKRNIFVFPFHIGEISKWLKGVDCKSIRFSVRGFESLSHHHLKKSAKSAQRRFRGFFRDARVHAMPGRDARVHAMPGRDARVHAMPGRDARVHAMPGRGVGFSKTRSSARQGPSSPAGLLQFSSALLCRAFTNSVMRKPHLFT